MYLVVLVCLSLLSAHSSGQTSLSAADKEEILRVHNNVRSRVDPTASNMLEMVRHVRSQLHDCNEKSLYPTMFLVATLKHIHNCV